MNYYLGFDAGTQSVKVGVYDEQMNCVSQATKKTTLYYPEAGWVEMDAQEYLQLIKQCMRQCSLQLQEQGIPVSSVRSIMGDGIICGIVGIDESGTAITPYINYLDSRTLADVEELKKDCQFPWGTVTGNGEPSCMFPAMHGRWFLKNSSVFQEKGVKFVHNAPYVLLNLAGLGAKDAFVDWGTMSGWGLGYNVYKKEWDHEQLDILGIDPSYMPRIVKPWDIIGTLSEAAAEETGFAVGTPICGGAGDTMQSMLGSGVLEAGRAVDVAGTCAMFCVSTDHIVPELSRPGAGLIFNSGTLPNTYFYWGFVRTGGLSLRWFKDSICRQASDDYYRTLSEGAAKVPTGSEGVFFIPYLTGGYGEYKGLKGSFMNMTLDTTQFTLWRSVLEAIGYEYLEITDRYRAGGIPIDRITVTEGGSRDDVWNQIKADMLDSEVVVPAVAGGAVPTNCIVGAYAVGDIDSLKNVLEQQLKLRCSYDPNKSNTAYYRRQYGLKKSLLQQMIK